MVLRKTALRLLGMFGLLVGMIASVPLSSAASQSSLSPNGLTRPRAALQDPGAQSGDEFGVSVSEDGQVAIIGADGTDNSAGVAYIYEKGSSGWPTSPSVTLTDPVPGQNFFGRSVSISQNVAIVGAYDVDTGAGVAYMYGNDGGNSQWSNTPVLTLESPDGSASFGSSVATQSASIIVGSPDSYSGSGAAYIYADKVGSGWSATPTATLRSPNGSSGFGHSVAVAYTAAIVGSYDQGDGEGGAAIYLKVKYTWSSHPQEISLYDPAQQSADGFGYSVAITGVTALVGAIGKGDGKGAAYLYVTGDNSKWKTSPIRDLKDPGSKTTDAFGGSVNFGNKNATISNTTGKVYIFTDSSTGWGKKPSDTLGDTSGSAGDGFADSVNEY